MDMLGSEASMKIALAIPIPTPSNPDRALDIGTPPGS
jgi:hypothetical protein